MYRWMILLGVLLLALNPLAAQDDPLIPEDTAILTRLDAFGLEQPFAEGMLFNQGAEAYRNISLLAEVYAADDSLIGEGFGFLVRACGEALVDFALQPGQRAAFAIPLDLFETEVEIDRIDILPQGTAEAPAIVDTAPRLPGVRQISTAEVVAVEWIDSENLRFSVGCWRDMFTNRDWYTYDLGTDRIESIPHPRAEAVTPALQQSIRLADSFWFNRSFFQFAPGGRRAIYQTDLNTLVTVEPDGSFPRVLYEELYNISLQGINWHKNSGVLLAYYHGGYGDAVRYAVANADGRTFTPHPMITPPSQIIPGFAANGRAVVIYTTVEGVSGYYLKPTTTDSATLMFEAEAPGNNWPAPFYEITEAGQRWIYLVRPVDGAARLQCYNPDSRQLHDYTALPLELATDERAWTQLSPDNATLALAANGDTGGLWLIDLTQFPPCD